MSFQCLCPFATQNHLAHQQKPSLGETHSSSLRGLVKNFPIIFPMRPFGEAEGSILKKVGFRSQMEVCKFTAPQLSRPHTIHSESRCLCVEIGTCFVAVLKMNRVRYKEEEGTEGHSGLGVDPTSRWLAVWLGLSDLSSLCLSFPTGKIRIRKHPPSLGWRLKESNVCGWRVGCGPSVSALMVT